MDYVNWFTPIDRMNSKGIGGESGVFATDIYWANGVRRGYLDVVQNTNPGSSVDPVSAYSAWMAAHSELFKPKYVQGSVRIEKGLPRGVEDWPMAAVHPDLYNSNKHPNAELWGDGFYHFPAPEYYVWRLVPAQ